MRSLELAAATNGQMYGVFDYSGFIFVMGHLPFWVKADFVHISSIDNSPPTFASKEMKLGKYVYQIVLNILYNYRI